MNQIAFISGGGKLEYFAPVVDIINVCTEKGFATSAYSSTDGTELPGYDGSSEEL